MPSPPRPHGPSPFDDPGQPSGYLQQIRAQAMLAALPDGVLVIAPDGTMLEVNPAGLTLLAARSPSDLVGRFVHEFIEPGFLETFKTLHRVALYGEAGKVEFDVVRLDGRRLRIESRAVPLRGPEGAVTAVLNFLRDISDKYQADLMATRLAAIVESSEDIIIGKDLNGIVTSWNSSAERILGYSADEMIGQSIMKLIPAERRPEEDLILGRIRAGGRVDHFETERMTKGGSLVPLSITVSPIRDREGRVVGASKIARDISERLSNQQKLARHAESLTQAVSETRHELERSNEALRRSERLAAMGTMAAGLGHDIGNLLLPMRSSLDILRAAHPTDPAVLEAVRSLSKCADYFSSMVRGLRLFGRGEWDDSPGDQVTVSLWAEDILPLLRNLAGVDVTVSTEVGPNLPPVAFGPGALTQAVTNLVKNCIDAFQTVPSESGAHNEVRIRAFANEETGEVCIEVVDNGPGMTPEVRRHCLEPYFTTHSRGQQAGTGLGLALVHRVVTSAGGRVTISSELGLGTTVCICLPAAQKSDLASHPVAEVRLSNPVVNALVIAMLRAGGYDPRPTNASDHELDEHAELWIIDSLEPEIAPQAEGRGAIMLLNDQALGTSLYHGRRVHRIATRPSVSDFMRCLENVRRDRSEGSGARGSEGRPRLAKG